MKLLLLAASVLGLLVIVPACKREPASTPAVASDEVTFPRAGISIVAGKAWQRIDIDPGVPVCPPTLVGGGGMVRAMIFDANRTDPQTAATILRASFESEPGALKDSFQQESFTTESGITGVHLSCTGRSEKHGTVTETRSHNYIIKNRDGRCVSISYIAPGGKESDAVHSMIRKTLKLQ
jgi:hypothetical protein